MTLRRRTALALARHRGAVGTLCAAIALAGAVLLLRPVPEGGTEVVAAARDLSPLDPVAAADLEVRTLPADAVPEGALRPGEEPVGGSLTGPVRRGEVLTDARLADSPAAGYGPGAAAVPVRVADAEAAALVAPGDRVDLVAAPPGPSEAPPGFAPDTGRPPAVLAEDRPVVAVPDPQDGGAGGTGGAVIVVAAEGDEAAALAAASVRGGIALTIRG
ncbi:SAF domain-containing protein [Nocardiopsis sp. RSe5-2]|uniref:SAF domain-containing protein n=1 Tax=Nocardiopsis endophytica TaxID=3018445 RepID=A0ABT4TWX0_9ACTN|nr:SAF domain-containing protein [Nocardiopsis endophytica]MDA2809182.1 SAF domain-containing protein [Nocardiopsis endophytica]